MTPVGLTSWIRAFGKADNPDQCVKSRLPFHPYRRRLMGNSYFIALGWAGQGATTIPRLVEDFGGRHVLLTALGCYAAMRIAPTAMISEPGRRFARLRSFKNSEAHSTVITALSLKSAVT